MSINFAVAMAVLIGITFWKALAHIAELRQTQRQLLVATRGKLCQGRIIAIQQPFLFEASTRLYFEFMPPGQHKPLYCCHVYRGSEDVSASLPSPGTIVAVRYLPERPEEAILSRLVARLIGAPTA
jgi:hypothetical protein